MTDPAGLRRSYDQATLIEHDLPQEWLPLLQNWFEAAVADPRIDEPNAVQLATVDELGPQVRTVLVKALDARGVVFYTNYDSAKAQELARTPHASVVFVWLAQQRQVRLRGPVRQVDRAETERYFAGRPRESQLGAWASPQSQVVASRQVLEDALARVRERFAEAEINVPPNWGGYLLTPTSVEFWQGRVGRMHDRIRYRRADAQPPADGAPVWVRERLAP